MEHRIAALLAAALLAGASCAASAQTTADFARRAELQSATLSPAGDYVALAVPSEDGMETDLQVVKLDGSGNTQVLRFGRQQHVADVTWTDDTQLVVSRAELWPLLALPKSYGELMSSDINGKNQETLFAYVPDQGTKRGRRKDEGFADIAYILDREPGKVLVRFQCWISTCGERPPTVIYKVDTRTGHREEVERVDEPAFFHFDQTGRARILTTWDDDGNPVLRYRPGAGNDWQPLPKALAGRSIDYAWFAPDGNTVYATASDAGEPAQLYKWDVAAGTRAKLAGRDDVEISYLMYEGRHGAPFAVVYDADKPSIQYLDPNSEWAQLHRALLKQFPGEMAGFRDVSRDGRKVLIGVGSDRDPGAWYLFDRDAGKLQMIAGYQPWIQPAQMAPVRPVTFAARDGMTLYGFVTAKGNGPHPMVVMAHGGPFGGIYDSWTYDAEAQFLASRGYAVLQVNFRGSGGRGERSEQSGWKEWGGKIQDDIADGVKWAIANGVADAGRICTYGASFGGYTALEQPILYPDLYKCAVGYAGVYDLNLMRKTDSFSDTKDDRRYFDRTLGTDPAKLAAISPALHVADIKVPVLLVHGKDDKVANFDQFEAMRAALRGQGHEPETLVIDGEGHGFYKPENKVRLFEKLAAFLDRYIGPDATASTAAR
jgi:dipeptidyl aminopeptidase/acylaminoacyl peptidase